MYVIGLTGGIGTGKSVVAEILREQGAEILNADLVGHEAYLPGTPVYDDIVAEFGRDVVAEDGTIDRKKLGSIVFSSPDKLARLNAITHPRMKEMMREKLAEAERVGTRIAVLEAALLFDAGWDDYREKCLENQIKMGICPPGTQLSPPDPDVVLHYSTLLLAVGRHISRRIRGVGTTGQMGRTATAVALLDAPCSLTHM